MKRITILILFITFNSISQNQQKIDSLHFVINNSDDKKAISNAYYDICLRYYRIKDSIKKYAFEYLKFAQSNNYIEQEAEAQNTLGIYYMRIRDIENAEKSQLKSLGLYQKLKDTIHSNIGRTLGGLGTIYRLKSEPQKAINYLQRAISILTLKKDEENLIKSYGRLGNLYDELGKYNLAEKAFRECEKLLNKGDYTAQFHFNVNISVGLALMHQGKFIDAERYFNKCVEITKTCNCNDIKAEVYEDLGILKTKTGNFPKALSYFILSDSLYTKIEDRESQERLKSEIGTLYYNKKDYPKAEKYYQDALKIAEELKFKTGIINNQSKLVNIFIKDSLYQKALDLNKKILDESKEVENVEFQIRALNSSGKIYQKHLKKYKKAIEFYKNSLTIAEKFNNTEAIIQSNIYIGNTYLDMKDYKHAEHYCYIAYSKSLKSNNLVLKRDACDCMYQKSEKWNNSTETLKWFKLYNQINDSIENLKKEALFKEIETKYDVSEKEKTINVLEQEKETLQNKFTNLLPVLGILGILALIYYAYYHRTKNKVKKLEKQKEKTSKKIEDLKKIVIKNHIELKDKTKIYVADLMYIKSDDHYLNIYLSNGKNHFVRGKLSKITEELPPNFIRCHRSYIVNSNFIKQINGTAITLIDKTKIPLSRTYKDNF